MIDKENFTESCPCYDVHTNKCVYMRACVCPVRVRAYVPGVRGGGRRHGDAVDGRGVGRQLLQAGLLVHGAR